MSFADAIKTCLSKYADFSGRARRSEFWFWFLFVVLCEIVAAIIDAALGSYPLVYALVGLAFLLPNIAVGVRRLHDTGRSGWWYFISLVPLVGGIVLLVFWCLDSQADNKYGPNPKGAMGYGYGAPPPPPPMPPMPPAPTA